MHEFTIAMLILAAGAFGISAALERSLVSAGLLFWVLAYLVPMFVK